jgi:hypothetical protein
MLTYLHILIACVLDSILVYKMNTVKGLSFFKTKFEIRMVHHFNVV